ncbi:MAG: GNAT family N-acetyltransferase [Candidatus Omnitrophica bacterium]|nr:GNAT family N-acetyltransferase [Candidatus Omnitrophota bacterium]
MASVSTLEAKVFQKIAEIPVGDWMSVFPDVLENYYLFKTLDESGFDQFTFSYIMIYDGATPVAAAACFLMNFPLDITVQGVFKKVLDTIKMIWPGVLSPKVLMCGLPMGQGRIGIAPDVEVKAVFSKLMRCLEGIAKEKKAMLINIKDLNIENVSKFDQSLRAHGFVKIESLPSTDMQVAFPNFDEYLKTLSRVSRDGLKRKFKKVDGKVPISLEIVDTLDDAALSEVYPLYQQTLEKLDMGMERVPKAFFRQIAINMPQQTKYFLWKIEGNVVAFTLCLFSEDTMIDYYLGFDYSVAYQYHLYFVRFRDLMRWCIARKIKRYEMGVTTYEPKRRLGFNFIRLFFYMKHTNPLLNPFVGMVSFFLRPERFDPVFKELKKTAQ